MGKIYKTNKTVEIMGNNDTVEIRGKYLRIFEYGGNEFQIKEVGCDIYGIKSSESANAYSWALGKIDDSERESIFSDIIIINDFEETDPKRELATASVSKIEDLNEFNKAKNKILKNIETMVQSHM